LKSDDLIQAVDAALDGDWQHAHGIVQRDERDPVSCRIHAVLHKIEGDAWNSRYWYARTAHRYDEWADPKDELRAIRQEIAALIESTLTQGKTDA
jgi:hypothetical protein